MRTSIVDFNMSNHSNYSQEQIQRKTRLIDSVDNNEVKFKKDILKRKKEGEQLSIGEEKLIEMIEKANKILLKPPTELHFSIHEKTKRISIKIINTQSKEIIREIPPEKVLDMVAKMWELAGLFVDEKV